MGSMIGRNPLLWILLGAFLLRGALAVGLQWRLDRVLHRKFLIEGDANGYWELGRKLAAGEEYAIYTPPRQALRMPGFPAFLAGAMKLTAALGLDAEWSYFVARLMLALVGTAACGLVYWLGRELFDAQVGLAAAALAGLMPTLAGFSVILLSETLFAAALLTSLIAMARLVRRGDGEAGDEAGGGASSVCWALAAGIGVALACYVRPSWLLFGPAFAAVYILFARRPAPWVRRAVAGGILVAAIFATLGPWAYRNSRATGHWIFTTLWVGASLYDGLNPAATGDSDMRFYEADPQVAKMTEYEADQYFRKKAWDFVRAEPRRAIELGFIKLWRYWKPWPNAEQFGGPLPQAAVALSFVPLLFFAGWGAWASRRQLWAVFLTAGPILYFSAIHMVFVGSLRYRLPVEYPLCVLSAAGLRQAWNLWPRKSPNR